MRNFTIFLLIFFLFMSTFNIMSSENNTVEFISPTKMGRGLDLTIRKMINFFQNDPEINFDFKVKNLSGANGIIALEEFKKIKETDKKFTLYSPSLLLKHLKGQTNYSYQNFTPVANLKKNWGLFVVAKDSPFKNINQVMNSLKEDPESLVIAGDSPPGGTAHLQFLAAAKAAGLKDLNKINYVSFESGQSILNLLGGHVDLVSTTMTEPISFLKVGKIRGLALTSPQRAKNKSLAGIPTLKERGIDSSFVHWQGVLGALSIAKEDLAYWENSFNKIVNSDSWGQNQLLGTEEYFMNSAEFKSFLDSRKEKYTNILKEINIYKKVNP